MLLDKLKKGRLKKDVIALTASYRTPKKGAESITIRLTNEVPEECVALVAARFDAITEATISFHKTDCDRPNPHCTLHRNGAAIACGVIDRWTLEQTLEPTEERHQRDGRWTYLAKAIAPEFCKDRKGGLNRGA